MKKHVHYNYVVQLFMTVLSRYSITKLPNYQRILHSYTCSLDNLLWIGNENEESKDQPNDKIYLHNGHDCCNIQRISNS